MNRKCDSCGKELPAEEPASGIKSDEQWLCKDCGNKFMKGIFKGGFSNLGSWKKDQGQQEK